MKLSVVVLTKNEEKNINRCLKSLSFADEIIVIDDNSTDNTLEIVRKSGSTIYKRSLAGDFAAQRNYGLAKAKGEWVLFIDADEMVTPPLKSEIVRITNDAGVSDFGFYIKRLDYLWGKDLKHGETGSVKLLRLAKKGHGKWIRKVHEVWNVSGATKVLKSPLGHYPHQTLREFIGDINMMTSLDVEAKRQEGKHSSLTKIVFWPPAKFLFNWKYRLGFLDGTQGFVLALMMSFHSFLSWSKLWINENRFR